MKKHTLRLVALLLLTTTWLSACGPQVDETSAALQTEVTLQILSQNAYLLPSKSEAIDVRIPCFQQLVDSYQIVALQEVFDDQAQDRLVSAWYNGRKETPANVSFSQPLLAQKTPVPEAEIPEGGESAWIVWDDYFVLGPDQGDWDQDGGLLILSRYRILKVSGMVFDECSGLDCAANKGVLYARIKIGTSDDDFLHLFNAHLQSGGDNRSDRVDQLRELTEFILRMTADDRMAGGSSVNHPVLLLGDLNIDGEPANREYAELQAKLHGAALLQDMWIAPSDELPVARVREYGFSTTGKGYSASSEQAMARYDQYVKSFWGDSGNVLADDDDIPRRFDYGFIGYGSAQASLRKLSVKLIPQPSKDKDYCLDDPPQVLGRIEGELAEWLNEGTSNPARGFRLTALARETDVRLTETLKEKFQAWRYALPHDAMIWRDGEQIEIRVPGMAGSFELDPDDSGSGYTVEQDNEPPTACARVSEDLRCELSSRTLSDHLGVALELVYAYPQREATPSPVSSTQPPMPIPSPAVDRTSALRLAALLRAIDRRIAAIGRQAVDWGIEGAYEDFLPAAENLETYVDIAWQQVGQLAGSGRFWDQELAAPAGADEVFGQPGMDQLRTLDENLEDLELALARLDTVIFTATGHGVLARLPQPGGVYPTWPPEEVAAWDLEGLWAGMVSSDPVVDNGRGLFTSRHLDHVHPYAWLYRTFLSFDTRSLENAGPITAGWLHLLVDKAYSSNYSVEDPGANKEGMPAFTLQVYAGAWDPVAEEGDGWGMGPGEWLYVDGSALRSWNCCGQLAGTAGVGEGPYPRTVTLAIDPAAVWGQGFSQFKFQMAEEGYPGAPGVRVVLEDGFKLYGDLAQQRLLVELK